MENSAALLRRLNPYCARALDGAASLCQTRAHAEILPEHWLLKLLEQGEGDLTVLARRYEWDMDALWQDLLDTAAARARMSLDTVPESITHLNAQQTALALEEQALLEDIAVGGNNHGERLSAIEKLRLTLDADIETQQQRFAKKKLWRSS